MPSTVRLTDAVLVKLLPAALIVSGYIPTAVFVAVMIVKIEVPFPVNETGLKLEIVFAGNPPTLKLALPEKLLFVVIVMLNVLVCPAKMACESGLTERKNGCCTTEPGALSSR